MAKWSEQPPSADYIDTVLEVVPPLLKRHSSLLSKMLPPLFGFGLFLVYFCRNQFYPSFDLFQFSSLLLAAALIGFVVVGLVVFAITLPGLIVFRSFLNTKEIKEDITYAMPYAEKPRGNMVLRLIGLTYFLPHVLTGLTFWLLFWWLKSHMTVLMLVVPVMVSLLFGFLLKRSFALGRRSAWKYAWASSFPNVIVLGLILVITKSLLPLMTELPPWLQLSGGVAIILVIASVTSVVAAANFGGWHATALFGLVFGLFIAGFSGLLTSLPETTVRTLGLGAYSAKQVIFAPEFCGGTLPEQLAMQNNCTLTNAHIVWSLGETMVIRPNADEALQFQLPARFVHAIVQNSEL